MRAALLLFWLVSCCGFTSEQETDEFIFATVPVAPLIVFQNNQLSGSVSNLFNQQTSKLNIHPKFVATNWARAIMLANKGEVDAIFPAMKTPQRQQSLWYSKQPLGKVEVVLLSLRLSAEQISQGWQRNSIATATMRSFADTSKLSEEHQIVEVTSFEQALGLLFKGRVDAVLGTRDILLALISKNYPQQAYHVSPISQVPVYLAFSKRSAKAQQLFNDFPLFFALD